MKFDIKDLNYIAIVFALILALGTQTYRIYELKNDSLTRFVDCFEPELYLQDRTFCKSNLEKLGVTF